MDLIEALQSDHLPTVPPHYRWFTAEGVALRPSIMRTGHLYHSFLMLWNHFSGGTPTHDTYRRKAFNDEVFTPVYIETSIAALGRELATRDLTEMQRGVLSRMIRDRANDPAQRLAEIGR